MPTIIDSLIVTLGIDAGDFNAKKAKVDKSLKDTGNEADKAGTKLKKTGKDGAEGFNEVAKSAVKFLAIIGGTVAIKRFAEQMIEANAALNRFSQNINVGVSTISAWSNAAELAGGSSAELQGTMDMLSKTQTQLKLTGESSLLPYFSALGLSLSDAQGKALPVNDVLLSLSDKLSKLDRTTAFNMGRMMGIDDGTLQLLLKGRSEVELLVKSQKESNAVTKQQAEEASRLQRAMVASKQSFEAFGRELLSKATPALEKLFALFEDFGIWVNENSEFVQNFLTIMAAGLTAIALATIPISLTAVAVVGLAAAIAALWQDYQTWKRGGDSLIDWGKWEPGIKAAGNAITWLKGLLGDLIYRAFAAADAVSSLLRGDWKAAKFAAQEFIGGSTSPTAPAVSSAGGSNSQREQSAMSYFQAQGWSKEQSAGIVANIKAESAFKEGAVGDGGKAYGIAQWHPDRQADFKNAFGKDIKNSSFEDQLAFIQYELTQGKEKRAGGILRNSTNASQAAAAFSTHYERPRDTAGEASKRGQLALQLLQGTPNASNAAIGAGALASAQANFGSNSPSANSNSLQNNIGEVKIYTAATDANGIAKDMGKSLDYLFTSQANYGLF
jgi:hypothetical protein